MARYWERRRSSRWSWRDYNSGPSTTVEAEHKKMRAAGIEPLPVEIGERTIVRTFWGKAWCTHLESFSDFENRLPRGRTYARKGLVFHLDVKAGIIEARVLGSDAYKVKVEIGALKPAVWKKLKARCAGRIGSMLELLRGEISGEVMEHVCARDEGLFPLPGEMEFKCSCPDYATMCKHVAAALYGVGRRLDSNPGLIFLLRGVEAQELVGGASVEDLVQGGGGVEDQLAADQLSAIFGIELDDDPAAPPPPAAPRPRVKAKASAKPEKEKKSAKAKPATVKKAAIAKPAAPPPAKPAPAPAKKPKGRPAKVVPIPPAPPMPRTSYTGEQVRALRTKLGMDTKTFARQLGASTATIARWESIDGPINMQRHLLEVLLTMGAPAASQPRQRARSKKTRAK